MFNNTLSRRLKLSIWTRIILCKICAGMRVKVDIKMVGIDHQRASVEYREQFALTKSKCVNAMKQIMETENIEGCIVISTCNRTEVWISHKPDFNIQLGKILCSLNNIKELDYEVYKELFVERNGKEAVSHLFELASGIKSKVFGEDQIITQVKEALSLSRENYCTDNVLEVLFRTAVTAAKKVKSDISFTRASGSAIEEAVKRLKSSGINLSGKSCMVIGNGQMGKLSATALLNEGADVTVTVRQYKSGLVDIPKGCNRISYSERMNFIKNCDIVISATASPNYTIKYEDLKNTLYKKNLILIDLAVPRDIESEVRELTDICLYDIDDFKNEFIDSALRDELLEAKEILHKYEEEFIMWYECKDIIPTVREISESAANDINCRVWGPSKGLNIEAENKLFLEGRIDDASKKVIDKLIFGLRDNLSIDSWRECVDCLSKIY